MSIVMNELFGPPLLWMALIRSSECWPECFTRMRSVILARCIGFRGERLLGVVGSLMVVSVVGIS